MKVKNKTRFIKVGEADDFAEGRGKSVVIDDTRIAIFRKDGRFYALEDRCSHEEARLSGGHIKGACVVCPKHGAHFDLKTGAIRTLQAVTNVRTFEVEVKNNQVRVNPMGRVADPLWVNGERLDQFEEYGHGEE